MGEYGDCILGGCCVDLCECPLIFVTGIIGFVSKLFIDGICVVVALAPTTKTMSGAMFHPFVVILLMSGWKFDDFLLEVFVGNLSL